MSDLINAWSGSCLDVSLTTDQVLRESYGQLDLDSVYRDVNAYLYSCPTSKRPRNIRRFLINWAKKEARNHAKEAKRDALVQAEIHAGSLRPSLRY